MFHASSREGNLHAQNQLGICYEFGLVSDRIAKRPLGGIPVLRKKDAPKHEHLELTAAVRVPRQTCVKP